MHLKSCSLAKTFSLSSVRGQPWGARLTSVSGGPARCLKASAALRSSLCSHYRTRHQPYLNLIREKVDSAENEAGAQRRHRRQRSPLTPIPASFSLTNRSRCPRSGPGTAGEDSADPRAAVPLHPRRPRTAPGGFGTPDRPSPPLRHPPGCSPERLSSFTLPPSGPADPHPLGPPRAASNRLTRVRGSGLAEQGRAEPGEEEQGRRAAAAQPRSAPGHGWGTAPAASKPRGANGARRREPGAAGAGRSWPRPAGA